MKKVLFALFSAVLLCACQGPMGPQGPVGPQGPQGSVTTKVVDVTVKKNQWQYTNFTDGGFNNYFYAVVDNLPELSSVVYQNGNVQAYIYVEVGNEYIQRPLPYLMPIEEVNDSGEQTATYIQKVDFAFGIGWVQFEMYDSDFGYELPDKSGNAPSYVPEEMKFRLVMTY